MEQQTRMRENILERIKRSKLIVADGAWGTMLLSKGLEVGNCPELWNLENKRLVFEVAKSYIECGSSIIKTNTFGGNPIKLRDYNLQDKAYELNLNGAIISREAAGDDNFVMGSIGPTGKFIFTGEVTEDELYNAFKIQIKALIDGGVDAILFETFYATDELEYAIKAAKENFNIPVFSSFTFEKSADGIFRTMMGIDINTYFNFVVNLGVDVIGTNCGNGFNDMVEIVRELKSLDGDIPILVNSNAGIPELIDGKLIYPETPDVIKEIIPKLIEAGAKIIGGCCGTTPDHIRVIKNIVDLYNDKNQYNN